MDPYHILGCPRDASQEDIKRRYRHLVKKYHPDAARTQGKGSFAIDPEHAAVLFQQVHEAHELIGTSEARNAYDAKQMVSSNAPHRGQYGANEQFWAGNHGSDYGYGGRGRSNFGATAGGTTPGGNGARNVSSPFHRGFEKVFTSRASTLLLGFPLFLAMGVGLMTFVPKKDAAFDENRILAYYDEDAKMWKEPNVVFGRQPHQPINRSDSGRRLQLMKRKYVNNVNWESELSKEKSLRRVITDDEANIAKGGFSREDWERRKARREAFKVEQRRKRKEKRKKKKKSTKEL